MTQTTTKPLPCPFCGAENVTIEEGSTYRWAHASCVECGAAAGDIRRQYGQGTDNPEVQTAAIAEWNTRDRREIDAKDKRIAELEANLAETRAQFVLLDNEQASANSKADRVIAELETQLAEARDIIANGREQRRLDVMTIAAQADVIDERNAQLAEARAEVERLRTQPTPLTALLLNEKEANEYKNAVATIELLKATRTVPL